MKVGDLVQHHSLIGIVATIIDATHSEIYWVDPDEPGGFIFSVWENCDFEVIG